MPGLTRARAKVRARAERLARDLPAARRLRFSLVIDALEKYAQGRQLTILDAGCGEGLLAEALGRRHREWTIVAVDADEEQLQRARDRLRHSDLTNVDYRAADLTKDLGQRDYDAVLAIECLVEIEDDDAAVASMAHALRPGGRFMAHVPTKHWVPVLPRSERTWKHEVRHGYTQEELTEMLSGAGFTSIVIAPTARGVVRVAQEVRDRIKNRRLRVQVLAYPFASAAVGLERRGLTWGPARALFVQATRDLRHT